MFAFLNTNKPTFKMRLLSWLIGWLIGHPITIHRKGREIILEGDFSFHTRGNLTLRSDQHVMIFSGQGEEVRQGYRHGIWLNPLVDPIGRPLQTLTLIRDGHEWEWTMEFDHRGNVILPDGWGIK